MRSRIARHAGVISILGILVAAPGFAQVVRVDPLAESALTATLRSADTTTAAQKLNASKAGWSSLAATAPTNYSKAQVVFNRGISSKELMFLASARELEVLRVEVKVPVLQDQDVFTFSFGAFSLEESDGDLAQKIDFAIAKARERFEAIAAAEIVPEKAAKMRAVARGKFSIYQVEAIASNSRLQSLATVTSVRAILRAPQEAAAEELGAQIAFRQAKSVERMASATNSKVAAVGSRAITPCEPIELTTGKIGGAAPRRPIQCPTEPTEPPPPPPPPSAPPQVTGESAVDGGMNGAQQFVDSIIDSAIGPNGVRKATQPVANSFYLECNSSVSGMHCPNDYTYTTRSSTGGRSVWGVGLGVYGGSGSRYQCGWYYGPYYDYGYQWQWRCQWVTVQLRTFTAGGANSTFSFGGVGVAIPDAPGSTTTSNFKVSTFAWTGPRRSYDGSTASCAPYRGFAQPDAPCSSQTVNGNFVEGTTGFEDKLHIPNPACSRTYRRGTIEDIEYGCFIADYWVSNLPAPYLDTTVFDGPATFVASVGSADGKQLRTWGDCPPGAACKINNGLSDYYWSMTFAAYGSNSMVGRSVRHQQAVTYRDATADVCANGTGGAPPGSGAACMFNVDNAFVGADLPFRQ